MFEGKNIEAYRAATKRNAAQLPGVMSPSFFCRVCRLARSTIGRQPIVQGVPQYGYRCGECVKRMA